MKKLSSACMTLLLLSAASFSQAEEKDQNINLMDSRISSRYIPISKSHNGDTENVSFLDRTSVKLHPYNQHIRVFTEVTNNTPALETVSDKEKTTYHSIVTHYYANCDKKELVRGIITSHSGFFGEGEQQSYNEEPRRWEVINKGSSQRNLVMIACALPLNSITSAE